MRSALKHRLLGLAFIFVLVLSVWLVYGVFTQKFTDFEEVTLKAEKVGLNLPERADVKVRGMIVGQVIKSATTPEGATLTLGIKPDKIDAIPANVTASLLPKTLFGEKYVALNLPDKSNGKSLKAGSTIRQTRLPIEVEQLLNNLYPLLRAVQPAEINYTLNALATALEGRGGTIGENIEVLNSYLTKFDPQVPDLIADLRLLADVADTYADVMPEVAATLRNTVKTGGTLLEKERTLNAFLNDTTAFANTTKGFLDDNGDNIIRLTKLTEPTTRVLAKYAPEFPCLLGGLVNQAPKLAETFRGYIFHININLLPKQPRGYRADEVPIYGAKNGPYCGKLPSPPWTPNNPFNNIPDFNDGAAKPAKRVAPGFERTSTPVTGTAQEKAVVVPLTAPVLGRSADKVDDLTTLLYGPLVRGAEVTVR